jgi:methionyl-tRNA synthetase
VANLEPAVLRGVESQGMLLAAQDGPKVLVLRPDGEATPGSRVS